MANITSLLQYYENLLIIQYNSLPKAQATIGLIAQTVLCDGVVQDIQQAYNLATAVGVQLDVLGKYAGIDRYFPEVNLVNYSALVAYSQASSLPASPPAYGLETYATFIGDNDQNGTVTYNSAVSITNGLSDANFRTLIYLAIALNNMNYSPAEIDSNYYAIFGTQIHAETTGNMAMTYFVIGGMTTLIQAMIYKKLFAHPMGVLCNLVTGISGLMFAMTDYTEFFSSYGYGYSNYSNYASLSGNTLTYSQIQQI